MKTLAQFDADMARERARLVKQHAIFDSVKGVPPSFVSWHDTQEPPRGYIKYNGDFSRTNKLQRAFEIFDSYEIVAIDQVEMASGATRYEPWEIAPGDRKVKSTGKFGLALVSKLITISTGPFYSIDLEFYVRLVGGDIALVNVPVWCGADVPKEFQAELVQGTGHTGSPRDKFYFTPAPILRNAAEHTVHFSSNFEGKKKPDTYEQYYYFIADDEKCSGFSIAKAMLETLQKHYIFRIKD